MQQTKNTVMIRGKIDSYDVREGTSKKGSEYVAGRVIVDCGNDNKVPVDFYASKLKKDGSPNTIASGINSFLNQAKTIVDDGEDVATVVDIYRAELRENFWSPDGESIIDGFRVNTSFLNRPKDPLKPEDFVARFSLEGYFLSLADEIKDDIPTGRGIITFCTVGYNGGINIFKLIAEAPAAVTYIKNNLSPGDKTTFSGLVNHIHTSEIVEVPQEFGPPLEDVISRTKRELTVENIADTVQNALPKDEFDKAKAARDVLIADAKARAKTEKATTVGGTSASDFAI